MDIIWCMSGRIFPYIVSLLLCQSQLIYRNSKIRTWTHARFSIGVSIAWELKNGTATNKEA